MAFNICRNGATTASLGNLCQRVGTSLTGVPGPGHGTSQGPQEAPEAPEPALPATEADGGTSCPVPGRSCSLRTPPSPVRSCRGWRDSEARDKEGVEAGVGAGVGARAHVAVEAGSGSGSRPPAPSPSRPPPPPAIMAAAPPANHAPSSGPGPARGFRATREWTCGCAAPTEGRTARGAAVHAGGCSPRCALPSALR